MRRLLPPLAAAIMVALVLAVLAAIAHDLVWQLRHPVEAEAADVAAFHAYWGAQDAVQRKHRDMLRYLGLCAVCPACPSPPAPVPAPPAAP
jgi:hypothetical protein